MYIEINSKRINDQQINVGHFLSPELLNQISSKFENKSFHVELVYINGKGFEYVLSDGENFYEISSNDHIIELSKDDVIVINRLEFYKKINELKLASQLFFDILGGSSEYIIIDGVEFEIEYYSTGGYQVYPNFKSINNKREDSSYDLMQTIIKANKYAEEKVLNAIKYVKDRCSDVKFEEYDDRRKMILI